MKFYFLNHYFDGIISFPVLSPICKSEMLPIPLKNAKNSFIMKSISLKGSSVDGKGLLHLKKGDNELMFVSEGDEKGYNMP